MKTVMKLIFSISFLFLISLQVAGQTPKPTVKPQTEQDDVVKISTNLIQLDVTVTDKDGKIISDLKPEDFEIYENNEKQSISSFSFLSATSVTPKKNNSAGQTVENKNIPVAQLKREQVRRTISLVVDDFSLSRESTVRIRTALRKFVDEQMQEGDLVSIVRLSQGNGVFQQFTSDRNYLRAAIERIKWYYLSRGKGGAFTPLEPSPSQRAQSPDGAISEELIEAEKKSLQAFSAFQNKTFANATLGSLNYIIGAMKDLPGRKSVLLFSEGFELIIKNEDGTIDSTSVPDSINRLADTAGRASVVIYTMDARGLETTALTAEDDVRDLSRSQIRNTSLDRSRILFETQDGLAKIAEQTGGLTVLNNNSFNIGIEKMLNDQKGYYLIGYTPDSESFDAKTRRYNKLTVKTRRPGLNVRYRSGFFGVAEEEIRPSQQTPAQQLAAVLNSPFAAQDVDLRLNTLYANDSQLGNIISSILYINARDLQFTREADGSHKAVFDVLAVTSGENDTAVDRFTKNYSLSLKNEEYQKVLRDGLLYKFIFPVKKAGAYQLRAALRDATSEKAGSAYQFIEVPDLKTGRLTLSGIVLENLTLREFQDLQQDSSGNASLIKIGNSQLDTSLRRFKQGTVLRYGYEIYNAEQDASQKFYLTTQTRIFQDGKMIFEGKPALLNSTEQEEGRKTALGAISLGSIMPPGDYVLQVIVTDNFNKNKSKSVSQLVQFEIVKDDN